MISLCVYFLHLLVKGADKPRGNDSSSITVENMRPTTWPGRPYHVGLYKDDNLMVVNSKLNVGNHDDFELSNELLFGVTHSDSLRLGDTFSVKSAVSSAMYPVNLNTFPTGVVVTLSQKAGGGEYIFSAEEAEIYW